MKNDIISFLKDKKILIIGFGREGKSAYEFVKENVKYKALGIADKSDIENIDGVSIYTGDNYLDSIKNYDIAIKSPGIIIKNYISDEEKEKITSLTDLFLRFCKNTIIGVTGTKGKSTTSSLIYHILKENGYDTLLIGNIGVPAFNVIDDIKKDTILVYELSCHQLEFVKKSPHISVLLNLYEEHLDHYVDINHYIDAKKNIYKYQDKNDYLVYGDIFKYINKDEIKNIKSHTIDINSYDKVSYGEIETSLIGDHFKKDIITAIMVAEIIGISKNDSLNAVKSFKGLEHRLEYFGTYKDIKFYNDSIATAEEAVMNAVNAIKDVNTIIIGGMDRGLDYNPLVKFLNESSVENILLLPDTGKRIKTLFDECKSNKNVVLVENMKEAVEIGYKLTKKGTSCLLSPAAASYGFYKNFEERGKDFKELVKNHK